MNISRRKKHHIWTVVVSRNRMFYLCCIFLFILFLISLVRLPRVVEKKVFLPLAKSSVESRFASGNVKKTVPAVSRSGTEGLLRLSSPVFSEKSVRDDSAIAQRKKEMDSEKSSEKNPENITEKSIVSKNLKITNATSFDIDPHALSQRDVSYNAVQKGSKVLIVHTHGCETYSGSNGTALGENGSYRTTDKEKNVTSVGEALKNELEKKGLSVIHDTTLCDYPSYNSSYKNSMELIEKYKGEHPDIGFVFDIHRDAISDSGGNAVKLTAKVNDELCAQVMIVCGTDASGLYHPDWRENLTLGLKIQKKLEEKYPGLARPLNLREERFNMHETPGSLIFEIGTHGNTPQEAKKSAIFLAECIYEVICN